MRVEPTETMSNFTPRAQQVLELARLEAGRFNHNFIGTEHLLLGLIRLGQGVAVNVLWRMGLNLENARTEVEKQVGPGPDQKPFVNIPYTPRVKRVLALAAKEAKALNHTYVGTEHILLGLLKEGDGVAARVLKSLDVDLDQARGAVLSILDPSDNPHAGPQETSPATSGPATPKEGTSARTPSTEALDEQVDTGRRFDVYCTQRGREVVVYRNARFKGTKQLFPRSPYDTLSGFIELEQSDGQTIFVSRSSVIMFCEPGVMPGGEKLPPGIE